MKLARCTTRLALAFTLALGPSFACATGNDAPSAPPPVPDPDQPLDGGAVDAPGDATEPPPAPSGCSKAGFCYVPVPSLGPLLAVSASSVDDAWMVPAASGAILRWDGTSLKEVYAYDGAAPASITFAGIWAEKKDHAWAAARGNDGSLFVVRYASPSGGGAPAFRELRTHESSSAIYGMWGTPAGDTLWIVTDRGVVRVREDAGDAGVVELPPAIGAEDTTQYAWRGVWGFGPDDVYVAGKVCPSSSCTSEESRGAVGHYDGTSWSITTIASASEVLSLRGTPPGTDRQLWYVSREAEPSDEPEKIFITKTHLAPVTAAGALGAPLYSHALDVAPACSSRVGHAGAPTSGWFSEGLLLCRWTGTKLEPVQTALGALPVVETLNGIWAGGADDAWIVGAAVTRDGLPARAFAARRTATTAKGEQP